MNKNPYRVTILGCYLANVIQAVSINLTPLLFLILRKDYDLSYTQFGSLVLANFLTQVTVDLALSRAVDRYGFRPFMVLSHLLCVAGLGLFAAAPELFPGREYTGFLLGTLLFSGSGGLFELLLSPIIDALPSKNGAKAMSLLHSMYAWGTLLCVLGTTALLAAGVSWQGIVALWAVLPLVNAAVFCKAPLCCKVTREERMPARVMLGKPVFYLAFLALIFGGAAEVTVSQWTSVYLQNGLGLSKRWGDVAGVGGFAVMLGLGRVLHGVFGERFSLSRLLRVGSLAGVACYLLIALSPWPWLGAAGCVCAGFCLSLLWPGTLVIASGHLPAAGAFLFALLAAGGDVGGSVGPWAIGLLTDGRLAAGASDSQALRFGVLCATVLPLLSFVFQRLLEKAAHTPPAGEPAERKRGEKSGERRLS